MVEHLPAPSNLIFYRTEDGHTRVEVRLADETVWMTQAAMAELYQGTKQNISLHLKNIFTEGELPADRVVKEYLTTAADGKRYHTKFYNLQAIIAVGYRVRSPRGVQFRRWATERLEEYLVKGFTMDDERLKQGRNIGSDYFDELLARIRDIRSSEKRFYQKIRDIYALAVDYDPQAEETQAFFSIVQNKLHFAVSGKTAAELISERADATQPDMGLTAWKGAKVRKGDVTVAKNYLNAEEMENLNRIVTMYLDFAEDHAKRHRQIFMRNWREKLDAFLQFNERDILQDAGKVTKAVADRLAFEQYDIFHQQCLKNEARQEALDDDADLKKYLKNEK
ncbi:2-hydroxyacid dehydrogenase [Desulfosarcina ovata subsp. sediminis]|uniref:2-hydroxyacid dehydrogenase n=1 Tax=Desulfosarcina ovata subsp. sediminis TaxID=885957 RepID=A0A5K7ZVH5_9BACT|nr:virulence RhuM family protein [Desulfosarcina ovata]BBO84237.1 2-hydroxyacid dehydrogenase [Desulfosarcina ovata subsp. sediminis]